MNTKFHSSPAFLLTVLVLAGVSLVYVISSSVVSLPTPSTQTAQVSGSQNTIGPLPATIGTAQAPQQIAFTVTTPGTYKITASGVTASSISSNSFYVDIDSNPGSGFNGSGTGDETKVWDIIPSNSVIASLDISARGSAASTCSDTPACAQYNPKTWNLSAGAHQLYINLREPQARVTSVTLTNLTPVVQATTYNLTVSVTNGGANGSNSNTVSSGGGTFTNCSVNCNLYNVPAGNVVTLIASPAPNYTAAWTGCTPVAGNANQCTITMNGAGSVNGLNTVGLSFTQVTAPPPVLPVISNVNASNISAASETVTWTTDIPASSQVQYGVTSGYGNQTQTTDMNPMVTSHTVTISGLTPNTTYNYRAVSASDPALNNKSYSPNLTFSTPNVTVLPPVTFTVTVNVGANGSISSQGGTGNLNNCTSNCSIANLTGGTLVTLTANPASAAPGYTASWTGCTASGNTCTLTTGGTNTIINVGLTFTANVVTGNNGPSAWWKFDEAAGSTAADSSGNGYSASLIGSPTWIIGKLGSALAFTLPGQIGTPNVPVPSSPVYTEAAWVKIGNLPSSKWGTIVAQDAYNTLQIYRNKVDFSYGQNEYEGNIVLSANTWYHVAAVVTTGNPGSVSIYVNGVLDRTIYNIPNVTGMKVTTIGNDSVGDLLQGSLDDVRIYNRALSASEILSLCQASGSCGNTIPNQPPTIPGNLIATAVSSSQISLSWSPSTDNVGVTGYNIYRGGVKVATANTTSYTDSNLTANTTYTYAVTAFDAAGLESLQSTAASATTNSVVSNGPYTITASASTGGTITPSGSVTVAAGANQIFTFAANSGYQITSSTVDGVTINSSAITSYTFSNVQKNHTISATFSPIGNPGTGFLQVSGNNLVYNGQTVYLRGEVFNQPDEINSDYAYVRNTLGGNSIRFGLNYNDWANNKTAFYQSMDQYVAWAHANNLWMIPVIFTAPGASVGSFSSNQAPFWTSSSNEQALTAFWQDFAAHYANEPAMGGYDIVNEPVPGNVSYTNWAQATYDAITRVDPNHFVVLETTSVNGGGSYASCGFRGGGLPAVVGSRILWSSHCYGAPDNTTPPAYPWWVGEMGQINVSGNLDYYNSHNVSWAHFVLYNYGTNGGNYSIFSGFGPSSPGTENTTLSGAIRSHTTSLTSPVPSTVYPNFGSSPVTPTATLSASPTSISAGQSSTLSWSSINATSCTGSGFTASGTSGSVSVTPSVTATYSLTCTGTGGTSAPASATVTVGTVVSTGNYYVTPSGSGSMSGSDWNNAYAGLPATLVRGSTYYIASGNYGSYTFNTPDNGQVITIKKAIDSDHGTNTGWVNGSTSYGMGQAAFNATLNVLTSNWVINGQVRNESNWFDGTTYGFAINNNGQDKMIKVSNYANPIVNNVTVKYVYFNSIYGTAGLSAATTCYRSGVDTNNGYTLAANQAANQLHTGIVISHTYEHAGGDNFDLQASLGPVVEYSAMDDTSGDTDCHGNGINLFYAVNNAVVRYNIFKDEYVVSAAATSQVSLSDGDQGVQIYGNIFDHNDAGTGIISTIRESDNTSIFNNLFINAPAGTNGGINMTGSGSGVNNQEYNNLFINNAAGGADAIHDYNGYSGSSSGGEANGATNLTTSIFVNYAQGDYRLAQHTPPGKTLSAPFDKDLLGNTRGTGGVWDMGPYQYMGGGGTTNTLTVTNSASSLGTVSGGSISCGSTCSQTFTSPTSVTLTATPSSGDTFTGWGGACSGTATTCTVTVSGSVSVTASFSGPSSGCTIGTFTCGEKVAPNTTDNVRATPAGTLLGTQSPTLTSGAANIGTITAGPQAAALNGTTFTWWNVSFATGPSGWIGELGLSVPPVQYTFNSSVSGSGTLKCNGVTCPASATVTGGTVTTLTATPSTGYQVTALTVAGSSGTCASLTLPSTGPISCTFTASANTIVAATFAVNTSPTASLTSSPTSINPGQSATLTWSSTNSTSCTGTGFTASGTSGSVTVTPASTATYSLICIGANGTSAPSTATVAVAVPPPPSTGDWYVVPGGAGARSGRDWNNATDLGSIPWSSIQAGNTVWIAGGNYSSSLTVGASGNSNNWINIKRVLSTDKISTGAAITSVAGWQNSFDSTVYINTSNSSAISWGNGSTGSYVSIDGRTGTMDRSTTSGIQAQIGDFATYSGAVSFGPGSSGVSNVKISNVDLAGAGGLNHTVVNNFAVFNVGNGQSAVTIASNVTITNCKIHGGPNLVRMFAADHITYDHCTFWDNTDANPSIFHPNLVESANVSNITYSNNDISDWQVEGIMAYGDVGQINIFGNVWHMAAPTGNRVLWLSQTGTSQTCHGPVLIYDNSFVNAPVTINEAGTMPFCTGSQARNNVYYNSGYGGSSPSDIDYEYSNGGVSGAHSATFSSNPFAITPLSTPTTATDYRLTSNSPAGIALPAPYNVDMTGSPRTTWTRGAFEFH
jgi:uncharacterized repeat protein (TIGR02543 family)